MDVIGSSLCSTSAAVFRATLSDSIGRKTTYFAFFVLGLFCYASAPALAGMKAVVVFVAPFCIIASMYGGGFATVPAYLKYFRHAVCRRDPRPFAHRMVDRGDRRSGDRQLPA